MPRLTPERYAELDSLATWLETDLPNIDDPEAVEQAAAIRAAIARCREADELEALRECRRGLAALRPSSDTLATVTGGRRIDRFETLSIKGVAIAMLGGVPSQ